MKKKLILIIALSLLSAGCNPLSQALPAGIVKSVNGGVDWQFANTLKGGEKTALAPLSISKLDFDPQNHQIVFAGTYTDGLFRSEDSGDSWSKVLSQIMVYDFAINPFDSKVIYAAGFYADHGRVLKTTDGGASWNQVYNEGSPTNAVRAIALNPINPNQIIIGTTSGTVIKSADGGSTWQLAKDFEDKVNRTFWQNGNVYVLLETKGLYKSTGFADNFLDITQSLNKIYDNSVLSYSSSGATVDSFNQLYVDFTTPSLIYITTDNGLYKTVDEGKSWTLLSLPIKPENSIARAIAISRTSSNIVYTSVGATVYKSLDGGKAWQTQSITAGGFVNYVLIDPVLPQIVYAGIYNSQ